MSNPFNNQNLRDLLEQSQISIGHLRDLGFSDQAIRVIEDLMGATSDSAVDSAREKFTAESQTEAERVGRTQSGAIAVPAVKADPSARVTYQPAGYKQGDAPLSKPPAGQGLKEAAEYGKGRVNGKSR